ncbi:MAG: PD40 domain-containing protein [Bacteroidales bacterium]|nr:PD40 domain-containing protein [Bacteroidales bacterium]
MPTLETVYKSRFLKYAFPIVIMLCEMMAYGQFYNGSNMTFGQNRIQHAQREWSYYRTDYADVYYYPQSKELAVYTAEHIPDILLEMEQKTGVSLSKKMQIIIYARQSDFMQSNIGLNDDNFYNTGGVSSIYANKIFLYFEGDMKSFHQNLRNGVARLVIDNYLKGSTMASNIATSYIADFPVWFVDGLSAYLSGNFTNENILRIKDGFESGLYDKFYFLPPEQQKIAGLSWWQFIANAYGVSSINAIMYYAAISHNYAKACLYTIGKPFDEILTEWKDYYKIYFNDYPSDDYTNALWKQKRSYTQHLQPNISPDGNTLAYICNTEGKVKIMLRDLNSGKQKCIYRHHYRIEDNPDYSTPLLAWAPSGKWLSVLEEWHDKVYLKSYLPDKHKFEPRQVIFINKITSINYSPNGKHIAISASDKGQSDIYIYNLASRSLEQITADIADDYAPCFIDDTHILFSSNRIADSINDIDSIIRAHTDLYLYNTVEKSTYRITHTDNIDENAVTALSGKYISFLSQQHDGSRRHLGKMEHVISRIDTGIHYADQIRTIPIQQYHTLFGKQQADPTQNTIYEQILHKGYYTIGKTEYPQWNTIPPVNTAKDTFSTPIDTAVPIADNNIKIKRLRQMRISDLKKHISDSTDTEDNSITTAKEHTSLIPRNYYVQYYINKLVAQADFSFLNTFYQQFVNPDFEQGLVMSNDLNGLLMVGITDIMEDHRMIGGIRLSAFSIGDMEILYSYENLKRRLDRQIVVHYLSQKFAESDELIRQQSISLHYLLKYPFDRVNSLRLSMELRYDRKDWKSIDDYSLHQGPQHGLWTGAKAEYIIDFTRHIDDHILKGFRGKIFAEATCTPAKTFRYLGTLGLDARLYTPLARTLIWANRVAAGTSMGNSKLIYYLGGVDNWILPRFNHSMTVNNPADYAYQTIATNMRGFSQNIRNGNNFMVLNTELRWQIIQTMIKRPIKSNFLRSLQLVGFFDIGTAWAGKLDDNYTTHITKGNNNNLDITVNRQINPFVYGTGIGLHFMLFSYFIRIDYAWGFENNKFSNKQLYISLNLDF